jgi:hypothetical protein
MAKRRSERGPREDFFSGLAEEIEDFLLELEANPEALAAYVKDRVGFLNETDLSNDAKALLLESDYSVVHEVMKYRHSDAIVWLCVWII